MTNRYEKLLRWLLVITGVSMLLALPAVFMPRAWMASTHVWLGMGEFPAQPIAEHLARWTSALYALLGVFTLLFVTDLVKYRAPITVLAFGIPGVSILLFLMDRAIGLPTLHLVADVVSASCFGLAVLILQFLARLSPGARPPRQ